MLKNKIISSINIFQHLSDCSAFRKETLKLSLQARVKDCPAFDLGVITVLDMGL